MNKTLLLGMILAAMLAGCTRNQTRYEIYYCFNNTDMQSDFLEAHELINSNSGNGTWRSERHHLDTVVENGDTVEWASGVLKSTVKDDCTALLITTSGWRPCGGGNYKLDTIFPLEIGEKNYIYITPAHHWTNQY